MNEQLFDLADFGASLKPRRARAATQAVAVFVQPPWVVLRHLHHAPFAHVARLGDIDTPRARGVAVAECGALGMPMTEFDDTSMPACVKCMKAARKRGLM